MGFPKEGWTQQYFDCARVSYAHLLDVHPLKVKYLDPSKNTARSFEAMWEDYLNERFGKKQIFWAGIEKELDWHNEMDELLHSDKNWIAIVKSLSYPGRRRHAINMKGSKLIHDSANIIKRKQKPKKIFYGITLEDI